SIIAQLEADEGGWYGPALDRTSGNLYVSHFSAGQVLRITPGGGVSTLATGISQPAGLTVDSAGDIYVTSVNTGKIFRIARPVASVFGELQAQAAGPNFTEYASGLSQPNAVAFNSTGDLFVGNSGSKQISKVPAGGGRPV